MNWTRCVFMATHECGGNVRCLHLCDCISCLIWWLISLCECVFWSNSGFWERVTLATGYVVQECKDSYEASITLQLITQLDDIQQKHHTQHSNQSLFSCTCHIFPLWCSSTCKTCSSCSHDLGGAVLFHTCLWVSNSEYISKWFSINCLHRIGCNE